MVEEGGPSPETREFVSADAARTSEKYQGTPKSQASTDGQSSRNEVKVAQYTGAQDHISADMPELGVSDNGATEIGTTFDAILLDTGLRKASRGYDRGQQALFVKGDEGP